MNTPGDGVRAYETAPPGAEPSWLIVYNDGRVVRDLAPYMKQAGHREGWLDAGQTQAVRTLAAELLEADEGAVNDSPESVDMGLVTINVALHGKHKTLTFRPAPDATERKTPWDSEVITSLLYQPLGD